MSTAATTATPAFTGWRITIIALGCALLIGSIGGLIGLGGGEFRLPILVALIGFTARSAVPMNQILSLVTLVTALVVRWHAGSLIGVGTLAPAVIGLGIGGITSAYFSAGLISKVSDHRLERLIAILLMSIGVLLVVERLLPTHLTALVPVKAYWQIPIGLAFGACIGCVSTFLGVAGGELIIPTLLFVFGADIHLAGSATLFISIPTVCMGLFRYGRLGLLPSRQTLLRIGASMGTESLIGAAIGGAFAGTTPAAVLKLMLGLILIAAAIKAFWKKHGAT
jgi:uncharacterized membrane protein YfcA